MIEADAIVIGSPVYYGDVTAQLKALMDRSWPYRKRLKDKVGGAIAVGGSSYQGRTIETINVWFEMHQIIIPRKGAMGSAWDIGDIKKDKQVIEGARTLGNRIFEVLQNFG